MIRGEHWSLTWARLLLKSLMKSKPRLMQMQGEICDDQALLIQEGEFTRAFSLATYHRIVDDQLDLFLTTGDILLFRLLLNESGDEN